MGMTKQQKLRGRGEKAGGGGTVESSKHLENSWTTCPGAPSGTPYLLLPVLFCFVVPGFKPKALPMRGEASAVPHFQPSIAVLDLQI